MTEKQKTRLEMIIDHFGRYHVESYIRQYYPDASLNSLSGEQAVKVITGLGMELPIRMLGGTHLRNIFV